MKNHFGLNSAVKNGKGDRIPTGDQKPDNAIIFKIGRRGGCFTDVTWVEMARKHGIKRNEMPKYLTWLTETPWDQQRVNIAWAVLRKNIGQLRAVNVPAGPWKPRSNKGNAYRQKIPYGPEWKGKWIFSHSLQGSALETDRAVMFVERYK